LPVLAGMLFVAGLLCVIETVVTLVWQDPLTMLQARASSVAWPASSPR
jgi:hypothetical protein